MVPRLTMDTVMPEGRSRTVTPSFGSNVSRMCSIRLATSGSRFFSLALASSAGLMAFGPISISFFVAPWRTL